MFSKIQIIHSDSPSDEKQEVNIPSVPMIRLEHRFTMLDLEELKNAFDGLRVNILLNHICRHTEKFAFLVW